MLLTRGSTGCLLLSLFLFGLGFQQGSSQIHTRSFCTGITMPDTRLCDDNRPIIEIVEVSQYDFTGDEYPGRPCVYSDRDCGRAVRTGIQPLMDIITHCHGERTCGGFFIAAVRVCSGRDADYMIVRFRCNDDETDTAMVTSTSMRSPPPAPQEATIPPNTTPTSVTTGSLVNPPHTTHTSATTGSHVKPPIRAVTGAESKETTTHRSTTADPRKNNIGLYAGVPVGGAVAVILVVVVIAGCVKRKKRCTESKPIDTNDGDTPAATQMNGEPQSSGLHTPGENEVVLEEIVTNSNANESSPEQQTSGRMVAANPAVSQHDPDLTEEDSLVGNNPGQGDTIHLAAPTADTQEDCGYSSVGAATAGPTLSNKEPNCDQHNTHTVPATTQQPVDTCHTIEPDVYATVQKDKPHKIDIENKASDDTKEPDVYATVQKDRDEDADELVMEDNPLYT